jgi:hypothetical protein
MSIRDLGRLAEQVRDAKPGTKRMRQLADRMGAASFYLQDSGALGQLLWWALDIEPEAPPDGKAEVVEFAPRKERTAPYLVL